MWPGDIGRHYGSTAAGAGDDDPFRQDIQVIGMQPYWGRMQAVTNGTDFIRFYAPTYLPKEPREPDDAYETRVQRSVLSPYTVRLIDNAAGLILRRPINIDGDDFWLTWSENVDGLGSSLMNTHAALSFQLLLTATAGYLLTSLPIRVSQHFLKNGSWDVAPISTTSTPTKSGAGAKNPPSPTAH